MGTTIDLVVAAAAAVSVGRQIVMIALGVDTYLAIGLMSIEVGDGERAVQWRSRPGRSVPAERPFRPWLMSLISAEESIEQRMEEVVDIIVHIFLSLSLFFHPRTFWCLTCIPDL